MKTSLTATGATDPVSSRTGIVLFGLSGTWVGTVEVELSLDGGTVWHSVGSYTANDSQAVTVTHGTLVRLNVTAYTSGTIVAELS